MPNFRALFVVIVLFRIAIGLLLDIGSQQNTTQSGNNGQFASTTQMETIKKVLEQEDDNLRHTIHQVQIDLGNTLALLTSQLQQKFREMDFLSKALNNSQSDRRYLENQLTELGINHTLLQQAFEKLQQQCNSFDIELRTVKNSESYLEAKLQSLQQLDAIKQLDTLNSLEQKVLELESKTSTLFFNEQARRNDFMALRNETIRNSNNIEQLQQTVSLTAVGFGIYGPNEIMMFYDLKSHVGVDNETLTNFNRTGTFVCKSTGLYTVAVTVVTDTTDGAFALYKNGKYFMHTFIARDTNYHAASMDVGINLRVNDTIWIQTSDVALHADSEGTCLTIIKIR